MAINHLILVTELIASNYIALDVYKGGIPYYHNKLYIHPTKNISYCLSDGLSLNVLTVNDFNNIDRITNRLNINYYISYAKKYKIYRNSALDTQNKLIIDNRGILALHYG